MLLALFFACSLGAQEGAPPARKNALKATFLSLITGSEKLSYERATFHGQSIELTGGFIGVGFDKFGVNPRGGLVRAGYKFILLEQAGTALSGLYVKPEYAWSFFDYDSGEGEGGRVHSSMQTVLACIGYQREIKRLVLDGFVGAGVPWGERAELQYHHGFIERYGWLTLTFSIKLGLAF